MRVPGIVLLSMASLGVASGQTAGVSGPVEGFTFDLPTASLRAVMGYPGAASFGPPILSGLEFASVAPQRNYAVAFQNGNFAVLSNLDSGKAASLAVVGVTRVPEAVSWSADGTFAVLWSAGANWLQTLSGLPSNPAPGAYIDVSALGGSLTSVALDTTGKRIAIGVLESQAGVYLMTGSQGFAPVISLTHPVAVSFSSDATELFAIDAAAKQLAIVNLSNLSFQMTALDGLADPFAVQGSAAKIYVASRSDRLLREFDATGTAMGDLPLSFSPRGIEPFGANSLLLASRSMASDPLWLVTNGTQPAAYFVPAIPQTVGRPRSGNPEPTASSPAAPAPARRERER
jgi:hypothetical protein